MGWIVLIVIGCVVAALGVQEVRTRQRAFPRPGTATPAAIRRDAWTLTGIGAALILVGIVELAELPSWLLIVVVLVAVVGAVAGLLSYKPREAPGRPVEPPSDPDGVWRRNPPGY